MADWAAGLNEAFAADEMLFWGALAVPTGVGMGVLGALAAQPHRWSLVPGLAAPALILLLSSLHRTGSDAIQPWPGVVATMAALVTAVVVVVLRLRRGVRERVTIA